MTHMVVGLIHVEGGNYGISFPDFPGCVTAARNLDEAMMRGASTLAFHVRGMLEDNDAIPVPRTIEELERDRTYRQDKKDAKLVARLLKTA